jgi:HAMP domain-containing protein
MRNMTDILNTEEAIEKIYELLGLENIKEIPHWQTILNTLANVSSEEIEKLKSAAGRLTQRCNPLPPAGLRLYRRQALAARTVAFRFALEARLGLPFIRLGRCRQTVSTGISCQRRRLYSLQARPHTRAAM